MDPLPDVHRRMQPFEREIHLQQIPPPNPCTLQIQFDDASRFKYGNSETGSLKIVFPKKEDIMHFILINYTAIQYAFEQHILLRGMVFTTEVNYVCVEVNYVLNDILCSLNCSFEGPGNTTGRAQSAGRPDKALHMVQSQPVRTTGQLSLIVNM